MYKIFCLLFVGSLFSSWAQSPPAYYGLPLGAVYFSKDGTQGEVYASDPRTLTIVNFYHKAQPGCTTFVAGPPRANEKLNVVATGEALMLPVKYRKQTRNKRQAVSRPRGIQWNAGPLVGGFSNQQQDKSKTEGIQWGDRTTRSPEIGGPKVFIVDGIRYKAVTPQTLPLAGGINWAEGDESSNQQVRPRWYGPLPREPSEFIGGINVDDDQEDGKVAFFAEKSTTTKEPGPDVYNYDGVTLRFGLAPPQPPQPPRLIEPKPASFGGLPPSALRGSGPPGSQVQQIATGAPEKEAVQNKPQEQFRPELGGVILLPKDADRRDFYFRNDSRAASKNFTAAPDKQQPKAEEKESVVRPGEELREDLGGAILLPSSADRHELYFRNQSKSAAKNATNLPVLKESQQAAQAKEKVELKSDEEFRAELGGVVLLPSNASRKELYIRNNSKPIIEAKQVQQQQQAAEPSSTIRPVDRHGGLWYPVEDPRLRPVSPQQATEAPPTIAPEKGSASHDWFIVEDPRNQKPVLAPANLLAINSPSQELNQELLQQQQHERPLFVPVESRKALFEIPIAVGTTADPVAAEINSQPKLPAAGDGLFYILPEIKGEDLTVILPESYDLTSFEWFGVYDNCAKQRTATVSLKGVHPPTETEIDGFKGWQHDVSSEKIHILNCNTMLISNFTYSGAGKTDAYLYVGNGDFPKGIIQKVRAYIVGTLPERILQNFHGEDVLVRLPPGWKTLDISWISVYNPRDNMSFGHALVPPIVAPPCDD